MLGGHLTVTKNYKDGTDEVVLSESNLLTKGLSINVIEMLTDAGSQRSVDFVPSYFQIGTDRIGHASATNFPDSSKATSAHFFRVSAAMVDSDYGPRTNLRLFKGHRGFAASAYEGAWGEWLLTSAAGNTSSTVSSTPDKEWFVEIEPKYSTKYFIDSVQYRIKLDEHTCNNKTITEVGLYCKNPLGLTYDHPVLLAYKNFDPGYSKTKDYSLTFDWSIGWLQSFTAFDRYVHVLPENSHVSAKWFIP